MSLSVEGKQCQMCNAYLFDDDDVVYCPECGAPHHRECYNQLGHCALEHLHGTDEQYNDKVTVEPEKEEKNDDTEEVSGDMVKCQMCDTEYEKDVSRCPECGAPNLKKLGGGYAVLDFLGGVPANADLGEGVTADEAKKFVFANSYRYIPKFFEMRFGKKSSWNWLAFLLPGPWMLSRKMYGLGLLFSAISLVGSLFTSVFQFVLNQNIEVFSNEAIIEFMIGDFSFSQHGGAFVLAIIGTFITAATHLVAGIFGDRFYRNHTIASVKAIKENDDEYDEAWRKSGGVNIWAMLLGVLAFYYLPRIIAAFLL